MSGFNLAAFRDAIAQGNLQDVKTYIHSYPQSRYFTDENESFGATALRLTQLTIYEYLLSNGFKLKDTESEYRIIQQFPVSAGMEVAKKVAEIHRNQSKPSNLKHLRDLNAKCKLSHNTPLDSRQKYNLLITQAFEELNNIIDIEPILRVVANAKTCSIFFDFNDESVSTMDPTRNQNAMGTNYPIEGFIYIGAKNLQDEDRRHEVLGVLAHEMCHYAMQLVYGNRCNPYETGDIESKDVFEAVSESCKENKLNEEFIHDVFENPPNIQHAELIVRVPHLHALYNSDFEKLLECQDNFLQLFEFYEQKTFKDLKNAYPLMEERQEIRNLNESIHALADIKNLGSLIKSESLSEIRFDLKANDKIVVLISNCVQLTMVAIYEKFKLLKNFDHSFVFLKIETLNVVGEFEKIEKAFKSIVKPVLIVDCNSQRSQEIEVFLTKLSDHEIKERVVLVTTENFEGSNLFKTEANFSYSQLTPNYQQSLIKKNSVNFQDMRLPLNNIINSDSANAMNDIPLKTLVDQKDDIVLGKKIDFDELKYYTSRKLLPSNIECSYENVEAMADKIFNLNGQLKTVILADEPVTGKLSELKFMADKLEEKYPLLHFAYLDLKKFETTFQKNESSSLEFNNVFSFKTFSRAKIFGISRSRESIFEEKFKNNLTTFMLDGYDAIGVELRTCVIDFVKATLETTKNQIWISTVREKSLFPRSKSIHIDKIFYVTRYDVEYSHEEMISKVEEKKIFLITDEPGMGKTMELKMMAKKLKQHFPSSWVVFIDMKEYDKVYEKDSSITLTFDNHDKINDYLRTKILNLKGFEAKVFFKLFNNDRVIFLFDGFDEISPTFNNFALSILVAIKTFTNNQLWISTRPHLSQELRKKLDVESYKLKPFFKDNHKDFFTKYLEIKGITSEVEISKYLIDIEEYLAILKERWSESVSNPLLMRIIAEIIDDRPDKNINKSNIYYIYERFVNKVIQVFNQKRGLDAETLQVDLQKDMDIMELNQQLAIKTVFRFEKDDDTDNNNVDDANNFEDFNTKKLINLCFDKITMSDEQIVRIGFMYHDSLGQLQFVHRTFAEFFVADFVVKKSVKKKFKSEEQRQAFIKVFVKIVSEPDFKMISIFLESAFDQTGMSSFRFDFTDYHGIFNSYQFVQRLVENGCINLIKIFALCVNDKFLLSDLLLGNRNLLKDDDFEYDSILVTAIKYQNLKFSQDLYSFIQVRFKTCDIFFNGLHFVRRFLAADKNEKRENILQAAVRAKNLEAFEFYLKEAIKCFSAKRIHQLLEEDFRGKNAFSIIIFLAEQDSIDFFKKLFLSQDENIKELIVRKIFVKTVKNKENIFHFAARNRDQNVFLEIMTSTRRLNILSDQALAIMLMSTGRKNKSVFSYAAEHRNEIAFQFVFEFLEESEHALDRSELKCLLLFSNTYCVDDDIKVKLKAFWSFTAKAYHVQSKLGEFAYNNISDGEEDGRISFLETLYQKIFNIELIDDILSEDNVYGENILFYLFKWSPDVKIFTNVWTDMLEFFSDIVLKQMLKNDHSLFQTFRDSKKCEEKFSVLTTYVVKKFDDGEKSEIKLQEFFYHAAENYSLKFFKDLFLNCEAEEKSLLQWFAQKPSQFQKNIFEASSSNKNCSLARFLLRKAFKVFTKQEFVSLLGRKNYIFTYLNPL